MEIALKFTDAPQWLDKLVFSRDGDNIRIEAVRSSGTLLGEVIVPAVRFNQLADMLLTA